MITLQPVQPEEVCLWIRAKQADACAATSNNWRPSARYLYGEPNTPQDIRLARSPPVFDDAVPMLALSPRAISGSEGDRERMLGRQSGPFGQAHGGNSSSDFAVPKHRWHLALHGGKSLGSWPSVPADVLLSQVQCLEQFSY